MKFLDIYLNQCEVGQLLLDHRSTQPNAAELQNEADVP